MGKTITAVGAAVLAFLLGIVMLVVIAVDDQDRKPGISGQLAPGTIPNGWEPWVVKAGSICPEFPPPLIAAQIAPWLEREVKPEAPNWRSLDDAAHTLDACIAKMAEDDKSINTHYFRELIM